MWLKRHCDFRCHIKGEPGMDNSAIIGEYFKTLRLMHGLSRAELAGVLEMSEKTLQRIELGQVDAKASQCLAFMDYFGVAPQELIKLLHNPLPSPDQIEQQLLAASGNSRQLAELAEKLRYLARHTHSEWLKNSQITCQIMQLKADNQRVAARTLADQLADLMLKGDFMTALDFWLLTQVADQVSYPKLNALLATGQIKPHLLAVSEHLVAGQFYCRLLDSALMARDIAATQAACDMIIQQQDARNSYGLYGYQQLAEILVALLRGQPCQHSQQLQALTKALATLCPPAEAKQLSTKFEHAVAVVEQLATKPVKTQRLGHRREAHEGDIAVRLAADEDLPMR